MVDMCRLNDLLFHINVKISVHVDDLLITGSSDDLQWMQEVLANAYQMKFQSVGQGYDLEAAYLNRTLRWTLDGIELTSCANYFGRPWYE